MKEKSTILIVDDSELNRTILADILGDEYNFIEAENGARAVLDDLPYHPAGDAQRKVDTGGGADSCGSRACPLHIDTLHACFGRLKSRQKCVFFFFFF